MDWSVCVYSLSVCCACVVNWWLVAFGFGFVFMICADVYRLCAAAVYGCDVAMLRCLVSVGVVSYFAVYECLLVVCVVLCRVLMCVLLCV